MKPLNLLFALWLVAVGCAQAQNLPAEVRAEASVEGIAAYRLSNGLQLLLVPDDSKPTTTVNVTYRCLLYTSPSPRDRTRSRMPSSA